MENPYQPPYSNADSALNAAGAPRERRPSGLNAVCIIAILLGSLGLGSSLIGLAALMAKPWMQKTFTMPRQPGMSGKLHDAQVAMQDKIEAVTQRHQGRNLGFMLANWLLAAGLLAGGIMTLKLNPTARGLLIGLFAAAILFEILRTAVYIFMQMEMATVMSDSMSHMMEAVAPRGGSGANQGAAITAVAMRVGVFLGIAFSVAFGLAKVTFYAIGAWYLRRPNIRHLFQRAESRNIA